MIRAILPADTATLSAICLATAAMGNDATPLHAHPELPALIWALPYAAFSPSTCFVAETNGTIAGYLVACPDTRRLEAWQEREWWPLLRHRYPEPAGTDADRALIARLHTPRREHADIVATHPAHLHINLLPEARGRGIGRALLDACLTSIRAPAIHAAIHTENHAAHRFFTEGGFTPIGPPRGAALYLGKTLPNRPRQSASAPG
jgi:GNAT superfamily N-acetyltransferase